MILLFFVIFITIYNLSNKMLIDIGTAKYLAMLSSASYYAIENTLTPSTNFEDFFKIEKNSQGDVTLILTDAYKFNSISVNIVNFVSNYFENNINQGVEVPIGVFTGLKLFSGFGKKVKMPLINVYSVKCDIVSSFTEAGINQTKHSLYINIVPDVSIVTRFKTKNLTEKITILIYENIIVGKIPSTYLQGSVISTEKIL